LISGAGTAGPESAIATAQLRVASAEADHARAVESANAAQALLLVDELRERGLALDNAVASLIAAHADLTAPTAALCALNIRALPTATQVGDLSKA
jgi:hypothetical protein